MDSSVSPKDKVWFLRVCHHISTGIYYLFFFLQQKCLRETYIVSFGFLMMQAVADSLSIVYVIEIGVMCRVREQSPRENEGRPAGHKVFLVYNTKDHFRAPNILPAFVVVNQKDKLPCVPEESLAYISGSSSCSLWGRSQGFAALMHCGL
jgi:hypothetical protein